MSEQERQELDRHGGIVRTDGPDANGITTYYAQDGYFVRIGPDGNPRMRGYESGASQQAGSESEPAATAPRGVGMTQQELEALLGQMGPLGAGDFREEVKTEDVLNPNFDGIDPAQPQYVKGQVTYRTWIKPGTNVRLTVKVNPDGTYTKVFDGPDASINPNKPAENQPQAPKEEPNPNDPTRMRRWNPKANGGQGAWEDAGPNDAEIRRRKKEDDDRKRQEADRNRPGAPTLKPDGKGGTIAVQTMPDGSIRTTPLLGVPSEASSKYSEVKQDQNTGQWHGLTREGRWEVISGGPTAAGSQTLPEGMPQFRPNFNDPDGAWGLVTYSNQLRELLTKRKPDGSPYLTQQQYEQLVRDAHAAATSAAGRLDTIVQQQRQAQANEISQRNVDAQVGVSRLNAANSATQTALQESRQLASAHTPESYRAGGGAILPAIMALQAQTAQAYGGMNMPARVQPDPNSAFGQMQTQSIPAVGELTRPAGPAGANAIGLGSVPGVVTPGPSGADVEAQRQQAMAANAAATRSILAPPPPAGPVPQATSMDASDPAQQGTPPPPPAPPVGTGAPGVTVQPVLSTPQNNLPPAMPIPPTGTLPSPGAMPAPGGAGGNVQMLPAINNLTAVTGIMSQRPGDPNWEWAVRTAAAEFGLL